MNHMTTCTRTSRMQATSHIPRLTEVKRACVLRDVRDSQTEPSPALLFWRSSHSDDWPLQLSASLAANFWSAPLRVAHVILEAPHLNCEVTLPGQFCLDRCCQSGNFLLRCNESRIVGLAVLILLLGGHQTASGMPMISRRCVVRTPDWHRPPRKKTTWNDHHRKPCSSSIRANGYVNRPYKEGHGYFCRLPAPVFSPL